MDTTDSVPELAVVIPAWNERLNLEMLLPALRETLQGIGVGFEIIVADAGSRDGTREAAERRGARVVQQQERGYGGALLAGFAATRAPYIVTMDADLSHRPLFLLELWARRRDAEVLIASRYVPGGRAEVSWFRKLLSHILNRTYARALSLPLHDLSSGFRMYRREALEGIELRARDFDALEEILVRVYNQGWRVREVPFRFMPRGSGGSHARLIKFGWAYLKTLRCMWQLRNSVDAADYDFRAFDSPIWLQRYWQRTRHRIILDFLEQRDSVLDIGCGSSRIILDLPKAIGLDILQRKLRWVRARHERVVRADCRQLPFPDESFEAVICSEVIEHVPDGPEVLGEINRVLRPRGTLILGTPDYGRRLWWVLEWIYGKVLPGAYADEHITHFTQRELSARLRAAGYEVLDCRYVGYAEMIFKARKLP
ncbi:MAG: glycosyltransferase [Candidatus Binatia bacterium]|jgi:dolichol-phosphate mannosyltransferase